MCWLGLARKPWLWPGFIWLWLEESQAKARARARDPGLAWPGPGLSHGLNHKSFELVHPKRLAPISADSVDIVVQWPKPAHHYTHPESVRGGGTRAVCGVRRGMRDARRGRRKAGAGMRKTQNAECRMRSGRMSECGAGTGPHMGAGAAGLRPPRSSRTGSREVRRTAHRPHPESRRRAQPSPASASSPALQPREFAITPPHANVAPRVHLNAESVGRVLRGRKKARRGRDESTTDGIHSKSQTHLVREGIGVGSQAADETTRARASR
ncbi:hypothetical protein B0H11DRAFT_2417373 [Mycena galericulata]|nr:hypothetical protein B0H11DRAFT_2417373 [Mycena galericulata]